MIQAERKVIEFEESQHASHTVKMPGVRLD